MTFAEVAVALAEHGLAALAAFHPEPAGDDGVPSLEDGRPARTLVLVGNAPGPAMWSHFVAGRREVAEPLDAWASEVLGRIALGGRARVLLPGACSPAWPFQRWAQRGGPFRPSPLGILIHPDHGLWHAFRGALVFAEELALPPPDRRPRPCDRCTERPCLSSCPVSAFTTAGYDTAACVGHVSSPAGFDCLERACRARRACPAASGLRYEPVQARFHMEAFLRVWKSVP